MQVRIEVVSTLASSWFHISAENSVNISCANKLHFTVALNPQADKTQLSVSMENYRELLLRLYYNATKML